MVAAGGMLLLPLKARAVQPIKVWRIGIFGPGEPPTCGSDQSPPVLTAFRQTLRDLGYVESKNYVLVVRCVLRDAQVRSAAEDMVASKPDAIVVGSNELTRALKQATTTVPIVFFAVTDPEREGLVASLPRPGGNLTGFSHMTGELAGKRLELLKDTLPRARKVAILSAERHPYIAAEAARLGLDAHTFLAPNSDAIDAAFAAIGKTGADGLLVDPHPMFWVERRQVVRHAAALRLPAIYESRDYVAAGGLMFYGASLGDLSRRAAGYVDRIFKGAKPADLPVEQPTKFEMVINLKTAKALGVTIPPTVLLRADELMQ